MQRNGTHKGRGEGAQVLQGVARGKFSKLGARSGPRTRSAHQVRAPSFPVDPTFSPILSWQRIGCQGYKRIILPLVRDINFLERHFCCKGSRKFPTQVSK